jgi:hypothetical protein
MQASVNNSSCEDRNFIKRAKKEGHDLVSLSEHLPCSLEAVDHIQEIYIEGKSKLKEEIMFAQSIPSNQRKIIDRNYLASVEMASREGKRLDPVPREKNTSCPGIGDTTGLYDEELIAQHYDKHHLYLK